MHLLAKLEAVQDWETDVHDEAAGVRAVGSKLLSGREQPNLVAQPTEESIERGAHIDIIVDNSDYHSAPSTKLLCIAPDPYTLARMSKFLEALTDCTIGSLRAIAVCGAETSAISGPSLVMKSGVPELSTNPRGGHGLREEV